ncbi:type 1 glutamine amidotransferase domain-containing protein [Actinoplanes sp. NEAU-A12]|uniref:Type 1 glutamine amidotransferase domain-containing protein n=1 Tax=Actinoplanes sandaracinus TaxID=3045177 RepID=A0ABT6WFT5_9ACTN|nr:type 1 glutamine amidotransferase domain-containing protein [Actinoplanes sandaracinus]MDI6098593.1 type 1 glutamine amidotransferase domain-containing protein [Actinoplanes sandaracinus]
MSSRVLTVLTSHDLLGTTGRQTGFWLEELVTPVLAFRRAGLRVDLASVRGGRPPVDPASADFDTSAVADLDALLADTAALKSVDPGDYAAVFLVGGHGTMWDFPDDDTLAGIVSSVYRTGIVAAVCHGSTGLLGATTADGSPLVAGRTVAAFSDAEEALAGADTVIPFSLQQRLTALGAVVEEGAPFTATVRRDGRLITGQNPASSAGVAEALVQALPLP